MASKKLAKWGWLGLGLGWLGLGWLTRLILIFIKDTYYSGTSSSVKTAFGGADAKSAQCHTCFVQICANSFRSVLSL